MNEIVIAAQLLVTIVLLTIGITTRSWIAHLFSFLTGCFLIAEASYEGAPFFLVWTFGLLALYPAIHWHILGKKDNGGIKKVE